MFFLILVWYYGRMMSEFKNPDRDSIRSMIGEIAEGLIPGEFTPEQQYEQQENEYRLLYGIQREEVGIGEKRLQDELIDKDIQEATIAQLREELGIEPGQEPDS